VAAEYKKGMKAGKNELMIAFGTADLNVIVERIVKKGLAYRIYGYFRILKRKLLKK